MLLELEKFSLSADLAPDHLAHFAHIEEEVRKTMVEGLRVVQGVSREKLDQPDLLKALEAIGSSASCTDTHCTVRFEGVPRPLLPEIQQEVVAVVRESVANAIKHAHAETILVSVQYSPEFFLVKIADNGVGFSKDHLLARQREGHWGIAGMYERAERMGGVLAIGAAVSRGTTIELMLGTSACYSGERADVPEDGNVRVLMRQSLSNSLEWLG